MTKDQAATAAQERVPISVPRFHVGQDVALHAACDEWMQGDRFGTVVGFGRARDYRDRSTNEIVRARPVLVKLAMSGRVRRFHPDNLFAQD